ncbi:hypothetical protein GGR50DRAFT_699106 [Xylaria sp. CBS 124048]|nr:hypothetical protein GGR50DRAFT_699106 [Xylaria sp. CBS 124048]
MVLPLTLVGAGQLLSRLHIRLERDCVAACKAYVEYLDINEAERPADPPFPPARVAFLGRKLYLLKEAGLALRKAIEDEERPVAPLPDAERLASLEVRSITTNNLITLGLEMYQRHTNGDTMPNEEFERRLQEAQPDSDLAHQTFTELDRALDLLENHDCTVRLAGDEPDWMASFLRHGPAHFFCLNGSFWNEAGAALLKTTATAPRSLLPRGTKRTARHARPSAKKSKN